MTVKNIYTSKSREKLYDIWQRELANKSKASDKAENWSVYYLMTVMSVWIYTERNGKMQSSEPVTLVIKNGKPWNNDQKNWAHWVKKYLTMKSDETRFTVWCHDLSQEDA